MTALLRSRLADAEARAFTAERSAKRARKALRETRLELGDALTDLEDARACASVRMTTLCRLAAQQLGVEWSRLRAPAASKEIGALVDRWLSEGARRTARELAAHDEAHLAMLARTFAPWLRGEDEHG